jgi:4-amino-4-deoxy-L-arabinose transferase-like glycosyltransferase
MFADIVNDKKTGKLSMLILLLIMAAGGLLLFANLGDRCLWQDEASTALIGGTVLKYGVPKGYDGLNYFSQFYGKEYGNNYTWSWHGWLTFYAEALSLKIFGGNTAAARLPFAAAGLINIFLVYLLAGRLFAGKRIRLLSAAVTAASVPFLLLARQGRYFAFEMLFATLGLYAYAGLIKREKFSGLTYFFSVVFLFHIIYVNSFALAAAACLHSLLFCRERAPKTAMLSAGALAVNAPFLFTIYKIDFRAVQPGFLDPGRMLGSFFEYLRAAGSDLMPLYFIAAVFVCFAAGFIFKRIKPGWQNAGPVFIPVIFTVITLLFMSAASYQPYFRNIAAAVPAVMILISLAIDTVLDAWLPAGLMLCAILLFSWKMPSYIYELTHKFNSGTRAVCRYLNENAGKGDIVAVTYGDLPIKFYTGLRVIGPLTGEDLSPVKTARWVIIRPYSIVSDDLDRKDLGIRKYIGENLDPKNFESIVFDSPDLYSENREMISGHYFKNVTGTTKTILFKRKK